MKMRLSILFISLAAVCSFAGFAAPSQSNGTRAAGTADVREINLDGLKKIIQREPKDTPPLLFNFWATGCDPCRGEFPDLVKADADYPANAPNFVAATHDAVHDINTHL